VAFAALPELVDSSVVSPAAMVVLAQSAVLSVREKTTSRPAFMMLAHGWSVFVEAFGHALVGGAAMMWAYALEKLERLVMLSGPPASSSSSKQNR
jgi:hypothetical protein